MDAYHFELAQLANRHRELLADFRALGELIASELPEGTTGELPIPSDQFPDATLPIDRDGLASQLRGTSMTLGTMELERMRTLLKLAKLPQPEPKPARRLGKSDPMAHGELREWRELTAILEANPHDPMRALTAAQRSRYAELRKVYGTPAELAKFTI
jgi:hypothetical protein